MVRYPKKGKSGNYPIGPAVPMYNEWNDYRRDGGALGFSNYIESNKAHDKYNRR